MRYSKQEQYYRWIYRQNLEDCYVFFLSFIWFWHCEMNEDVINKSSKIEEHWHLRNVLLCTSYIFLVYGLRLFQDIDFLIKPESNYYWTHVHMLHLHFFPSFSCPLSARMRVSVYNTNSRYPSAAQIFFGNTWGGVGGVTGPEITRVSHSKISDERSIFVFSDTTFFGIIAFFSHKHHNFHSWNSIFLGDWHKISDCIFVLSSLSNCSIPVMNANNSLLITKS